MAPAQASDATERWTATRRRIFLGCAGAVLSVASFSAWRFARALAAAKRRVSGASEIVQTRAGALEYAVAGDGAPVLMIHGAGGGFDQGLSFASGLVRRGRQVIAPSRFGYLRSSFPADPSSQCQADAFAELLDHLHIARLPVIGGSAGALSAFQFALRHPERCSQLILVVPAANVRGRDPVEMSPMLALMVTRVLRSDFLYWTAMNAMPDRLVGTLLATDPKLLDRVSAAERARARRILEEMLPVSARARGLLNDARLAGSPAGVEFNRIGVPTLVISVEDDRFGTAATARAIAREVPGARLVIYPSGGHIWLGHDEEVADEMNEFINGSDG